MYELGPDGVMMVCAQPASGKSRQANKTRDLLDIVRFSSMYWLLVVAHSFAPVRALVGTMRKLRLSRRWAVRPNDQSLALEKASRVTPNAVYGYRISGTRRTAAGCSNRSNWRKIKRENAGRSRNHAKRTRRRRRGGNLDLIVLDFPSHRALVLAD
jgi:hypothetical protein